MYFTNPASGRGPGPIRGPLVGAPCPSRPWHDAHPYFTYRVFPFCASPACVEADAGGVLDVAAWSAAAPIDNSTVAIPAAIRLAALCIAIGMSARLGDDVDERRF